MNCLSDLVCEYHSKHGLIETVIILSINDGDCVINIQRDNSLIRTEMTNIRFLIHPHQSIEDITSLSINDELLLKEETFCTFVTLVKICDDGAVDVLIKSNILVDGEQILHVHINNLSTRGEYMNIDGMQLLDLDVDVGYCRYLNNIAIFKSLLSRVKNVLICWHADESIIRVRAVVEESLKSVELLMPVFLYELGVLLNVDTKGHMEALSRYIVWEYQYEDEEEANFAIGSKGAHIVAVRNMTGIAGAVLTKANRLRIIAQNKYVLKEARLLLEIKRESYLFEDSIVPMLVGKNASHVNDLINKTGLHCIHLPNNPSNGVIKARPLIVDASMIGKRELFLFGTRDSINSAKLLLEMEESVKDIRRQLESQKLNQNSSSTSSVSKDCEKVDDGVKDVDIDKDEGMNHGNGGNNEKCGNSGGGMKHDNWEDKEKNIRSDGGQKQGSENKERCFKNDYEGNKEKYCGRAKGGRNEGHEGDNEKYMNSRGGRKYDNEGGKDKGMHYGGGGGMKYIDEDGVGKGMIDGIVGGNSDMNDMRRKDMESKWVYGVGGEGRGRGGHNVREEEVAVLDWADTPIEDSDDEPGLDKGNGEVPGHEKVSEPRNPGRPQHRKPQHKPFNYQGGGSMIFTNSSLSSASESQLGRNRSSGRQGWSQSTNHNNYYHQYHQPSSSSSSAAAAAVARNRHSDNDPSVFNQTCAR